MSARWRGPRREKEKKEWDEVEEQTTRHPDIKLLNHLLENHRFWKPHENHLVQGSANFSYKGPSNLSGFTGYAVSVSAIQPCHRSALAARDM